MATIPAQNQEMSYVNDVFNNSKNTGALLNPLNYAAAAVDAVATIPNIVLPDSWKYDSVIPDSFAGYHARRGAFDAITGVATVFTGVGVGTKAAQLGGFMDRVAATAGVSERARMLMFADTASLAKYDDLMQTAMSARANAFATTGRTTTNVALRGRLDDSASELALLTGANTYEGAAQWASRLNVRNGLKTGIAQEATVFALGSQNEFLFPEDAGFANLLGFGALGVGLNVGVDVLMRRAAQRKILAVTAQQASERAGQVGATRELLTEGGALGSVVGEQWQNQGAALFGARALDEIEANIDTIVAAGKGALSREAVMDELTTLRGAYRRSGIASAESQFKNRINNPVTRSGYGTMPSVSREFGNKALAINAWDRMTKNDQLVGALAELGDSGYVQRWHTVSNAIADDIFKFNSELEKALATGDQNAIRNAQKQVDDARSARATLNDTRAFTIEAHAVANPNPWRATPYWETGQAQKAQMTRTDIAALQDSPVGVNLRGTPVKFSNNGMPAPVDMAALEFDDVTALYTTFGRMADNETGAVRGVWSNEFWRNYVNDPQMRWEDLPFPLQDAIASGKMRLPADLANLPKATEMRTAIQTGMMQNAALANKLDWWRMQQRRSMTTDGLNFARGKLDLMDAEKALNLRLTDKAGNPTILGRAVQAFADAPSDVSARSFLVNKDWNANKGLDNLFDLGHGASGGQALGMAEALRPDFDAGLGGIGAFEGHKPQNHGIGALYHRVDMPTDGEMAMARLAAVRNADRLERLFDSPSRLVSAVSYSITENQAAYEGASAINSLFDDVFVKGNTIQQTTNQHKYQLALQYAASLEKAARSAHDNAVKEILEPLARNVRNAMKSPEWPNLAPQLSNTQQLVARGVSLTEDFYVSGVNKIDLSRPGAKQLLAELGPLEGAPAKIEDWLMFDISIAANQGRYVPVQLSDNAARLLNGYADASHEVFAAINSLRASAGMPPMERLLGHMPTMNFSRYKMRYIEDTETGRVVGFVKGKTDAEADRALLDSINSMNDRRARAKASGSKIGGEVRAIGLDEIKEHYDAIDEVFLHNLRDFSGVKQTGTASGKNADFRLDVSTDLAEDLMIALRNSFDDVRRRTIAATMAPQLNELRMAMRKAGERGSGTAQRGYFNAIEQYQNVLLGDNRLPEESLARKVHATATDMANWASGALAENVPYVWRALSNKVNGFATPSEAAFAEKVLANYQPLSGLVKNEELAKYLKVGTDVDPYRIEKGLQMANRGVAAALLKIANVAHPILNYAGIMVTSPSVLSAMKRMPNETAEAWKVRVGPLADMISDEHGVASVNPYKLMIEGFESMLKNPDILQEAAQRGMIEANMLEELNRLNNLRPSKFVDGLEAAAKYGDFINVWLTPAIKRVTGKTPSAYTLSERSESGSRAWVHMMGYTLAKRGGVASEAERHAYAHLFANQNIADYSPNLRGQAFRGMAGIPFGLFQSYAINLYQRLFNYVGDGNKRALLVQAATQASMFGVSGLPGWDVLNKHYFPTKDINAGVDGANLNERIYNGFGKGTADLLMSGTLSNLPRLLGGDAINLFTSGDMNLRAGVVPPAFSVMGQTGQMVSELFKRTAEELGKTGTSEPYDPSRVMEVFANYAPMRGYRAMADLAIGEKVDRNGNLLIENTRSGTALLARMLGTRTMDEMRLGEAIYANSQAMSQRQQDLERLRSQMLRSIRDGSMSNEALADYMVTYLAKGGRADQWDRWVKYTSEKAGMTRADRALEQIIGAGGEIWPHQLTSVTRLQAAGVEPSDEMRARQP